MPKILTPSEGLRAKKNPIHFAMVGNWAGVEAALEALPSELKSSAMWGQRKSAEDFVKIVKGHIQNDDLNLTPKSYNSNDSRPLVNNQLYLNSIKAWRKNGVYYAGVPMGIYEPSGIQVSILASILEHGNRRGRAMIPPRPVWSMSYRELGGKRQVKQNIVNAIHNKMKKLEMVGFIVNQKTLFR